MVKKAVQRGRSQRGGEAYSVRYVEPPSPARTKLADFFNILPGRLCRVPAKRAAQTSSWNPVGCSQREKLRGLGTSFDSLGLYEVGMRVEREGEAIESDPPPAGLEGFFATTRRLECEFYQFFSLSLYRAHGRF